MAKGLICFVYCYKDDSVFLGSYLKIKLIFSTDYPFRPFKVYHLNNPPHLGVTPNGNNCCGINCTFGYFYFYIDIIALNFMDYQWQG